MLTIAGLIGIRFPIPAGAVIDAARCKRAILIGRRNFLRLRSPSSKRPFCRWFSEPMW